MPPLIPGRLNLNVNLHRTPLAHPVGVSSAGREGVQVNVIGGMTMLEHVAAQIATGIFPPLLDELGKERSYAQACQDAARIAVDLAQALLNECSRRQAQPASPLAE